MINIKLDMLQTLGFTVLLVWLGNYLRSKVPILVKYCIPSAVIGGLIFSVVACGLYVSGIMSIGFDSGVINKFFYCIFFAASGATAGLGLLKKGGKLILIFSILAGITSFLQNALAVSLGKLLGVEPLVALMTGSIPLTGGHGNAASFGPIAANMGANGAVEVAIAAATFGLIAGSVIGGPIGNRLVLKNKLKGEDIQEEVKEETKPLLFDAKKIFNAANLLFLSCGIGGGLFALMKFLLPSINLPVHVLCMLGGLIIRNVYDKIYGEDEVLYESFDVIGEISLSMFVTISIMTMKLWELADLAGPMVILLIAQVLLVTFISMFVAFKILGRDYDAAIMAVGYTGFSLGAVPVSMTTMKTVCDKYGYSKIAFFVVPVIGGLISNFTNATIITIFLNFFGK